MEESLLFVAALIAVLIIVGFITNKFILSPKKEQNMFETVKQFTELGIEVANKCIQITDTDIEAFDSEEDYINFLTSIVADEFIKQLKELGLYNKSKLYFDDENLKNFIKLLFDKNKDRLHISSLFELDNKKEKLIDDKEENIEENDKILSEDILNKTTDISDELNYITKEE